MRHEDYKELLALEAAGSLEEGERGPLEEHLSSCAECREELREFTAAAAALAYTVAPAAPPAQLRSLILESVRAQALSKRDATSREAAFGDAPNAVTADGPNARHAPSVVGDARELLSRLSLWQLLRARPSLAFGAAAAAAALALLGATSFALWGQNKSLSGEVARLAERLRESQGELAGQREQLARTRDVSDVLTSPGARVARLAPKGVAPGASAMVAYDRSTGRAELMAAGLPPAPAGKEYQLWFIAGGKPLPGGTFKTAQDGRARMSDRIPAVAGDVTFAVTLEREGGEAAPKGEMYLLGSAS